MTAVSRAHGQFPPRGKAAADDVANVRANSWNYGSDLNLRYPVNDRYYLTSSSDVNIRDYTSKTPYTPLSNPTSPRLFDLSSYAESVDLNYVYTSKLNLLGGYRVRFGQADGGTNTQDSALTVGATGGILPKLNGSVQAGYQWRDESGPGGGHYDSTDIESFPRLACYEHGRLQSPDIPGFHDGGHGRVGRGDGVRPFRHDKAEFQGEDHPYCRRRLHDQPVPGRQRRRAGRPDARFSGQPEDPDQDPDIPPRFRTATLRMTRTTPFRITSAAPPA